jgi:hypothetical protein
MKVFLLVLALLIIAPVANAAFLITEPMAGVALYDVEVDGVVIENVTAEANGSLKFDVDSLAIGSHTFRVKPEGQGGWPTIWSDPFAATKPGQATITGIVP